MKRFLAAVSVLALTVIPGPLRSADAAPAPSSFLAKIVFQGASPDWSTGQLFTMNTDGTGMRQITTDAANLAPTWSPDGRSIAFFHYTTTQPVVVSIDVMNAKTGEVHTVTGDPCAGGTYDRIGWSPDSSQLVFATNCNNRALWKVNVDGTSLQMIHSFPEGGGLDAPSWSPDGSAIVFGYAAPSAQPVFRIFSISPDGESLKQLTNNGPAGAYSPVYSPDGSQIAYTQDGRAGVIGIYVMGADGSSPRMLTQFGKFAVATPSWSPTGNQVVFSSTEAACEGCPGTTMDIFTARVPKPAFQRLTLFRTPLNAFYPTWQPHLAAS